ncbi:MAG: NAD(P)-binding protein [Bacteroidetes bacterium]|nr:NAD(P)-binding protein [Bacteroidota bacterium]
MYTRRPDPGPCRAREQSPRFLREIFAEVRRVVGSDFIVGIRMPSDEFLSGGLTSQNMVDIGLMLKPYLDYIDVSGASEHGRKGGLTIPAVMSNDFGEGVYLERASALRDGVGLPVLLTGRITDPAYADKVLGEGKVDLVGMVRAFIADPEWAKKAREGDAGDIRMCTGDNEGCRRRTQVRGLGGGLTLGCTQNAAVGREKEMEIVPASTPKRVVVIGGGPGGMEAARIAALRGHQVTLYEKGAELGGQVLTAARDPRQKSLFEAVRYRTGQLYLLGKRSTAGPIDRLHAEQEQDDEQDQQGTQSPEHPRLEEVAQRRNDTKGGIVHRKDGDPLHVGVVMDLCKLDVDPGCYLDRVGAGLFRDI